MQIIIENPFSVNIAKAKAIMHKLNAALDLGLDFLYLHFLSDENILTLNKEYLKHNYYTDILTFDLRDSFSNDAEIYISVDRVNENASKLFISKEEELCRVCIHGMLHLAGFGDKTDTQKKNMRNLENKYLDNLFHVKQ